MFGIISSPKSQDIGQNSDEGISDFRISGQSLIKVNCHNSRTSDDDTDMKLGPVTKRDKRNKTTSKKFDGEVISTNCVVIVIFPIYGQFGAIQKSNSARIACKTKKQKTENRTKKSLTQLSHYCSK